MREDRPAELSVDAVSDGPGQHRARTTGATQRHRQLLGGERRGALRHELHWVKHTGRHVSDIL